jgi:hypothetical protein
MRDFVKIIFFIIAGIFFVSYVQDAGIGNTSQTRFSNNIENSYSYIRSVDSNSDGVITEEERRDAELSRISREIAEIEKQVSKLREEQNRSPYYGKIMLRQGDLRTDDPRKEYVIIEASFSNNTPVVITGWTLASLVTGKHEIIPGGIALLEGIHTWKRAQNVFLAPGEQAIISSRSPVGINIGFLENKCSGFLETTYNFTPSIFLHCPALKDTDQAKMLFHPLKFKDPDDYDKCWDAIEQTRMCQKGTYTKDTPKQCKTFIREYSTYEGCVNLHKTDEDFFGNQWRLFLGSRKELWRNTRETIVLLDHNGLVVDILEYR